MISRNNYRDDILEGLQKYHPSWKKLSLDGMLSLLLLLWLPASHTHTPPHTYLSILFYTLIICKESRLWLSVKESRWLWISCASKVCAKSIFSEKTGEKKSKQKGNWLKKIKQIHILQKNKTKNMARGVLSCNKNKNCIAITHGQERKKKIGEHLNHYICHTELQYWNFHTSVWKKKSKPQVPVINIKELNGRNSALVILYRKISPSFCAWSGFVHTYDYIVDLCWS